MYFRGLFAAQVQVCLGSLLTGCVSAGSLSVGQVGALLESLLCFFFFLFLMVRYCVDKLAVHQVSHYFSC